MSSEQTLSSYEAALQDLETERDELNLLIEALKKRIANAGGRITQSMRATNEKDIAADTFFNMTIADAAHKYLEIVKQTRSTSEIAQALERGGLKHASKDFNTTIRSTLGLKGDFIRVNNLWGLTEWYPGARREKKEKAAKSTDTSAPVQSKQSPKHPKPNGKATASANDGLNQAERTKAFLAT